MASRAGELAHCSDREIAGLMEPGRAQLFSWMESKFEADL